MNDAQMREPLFDWLEAFYGKIRVFEEKNTGASRADVIGIIDDAVLGFEIKSDRDTYTRLKTQTLDYDRLCDYNFLVIGKSHLAHAAEHVPPHWGIIVVEETEDGEAEVTLDTLPAVNVGVKKMCQIEMLWRPELQMLLEENELPLYKGKSKAFVREKLLEKVPWEKLKRQITDTMFERDYEELLEQIQTVRKEAAAKTGRRVRRTRRIRRRRSAKK